MGALVLGGLALIVAIAMLRWFAGADTKALLNGLRWFGAGTLLLAAIGLAAIDRVALAMLAGSMAWGLFTGGHAWPGGWPDFHRRRSASGAGNATVSYVKTQWLDMELDHVSAEMTGQVLKGDYAGRSLGDLSGAELGAIRRHIAADDAESLSVLEAYIERRFGPGWREASEFAPPPRSGMSLAEAHAVLGLPMGASPEDIRAAHRRLILQNHPDKGGSSYLAAKINEAKDILLGA